MKNQRAIWVATLLCSAAMTPFNSRAFDSGSDGSYSGSDGSNGALNITTIGTNLVTMPADGVFRCTTITVATNCTLIFTTNALNTPVYLLAQSNIVINGIIDVSGADGQTNGTFSLAGPGGFAGGLAGQQTLAPSYGQGPGGGHNNITQFGYGGSFGTPSAYASNTYGNLLLVPLIGGSGGGGSFYSSGTIPGASGGAGGGAILLASSTSVNVSGSIVARGGKSVMVNNPYYSGGGSGGAVRLVAPIVSVAGSIDVSGGTNSILNFDGYGGNGRVRIDTTSSLNAKMIGGYSQAPAAAPVVSYGRSFFIFPPASPQLFFTTVGGTNIQAGTNNNVIFPTNSSTNQVVTLCGTNFLGTVPVQIVATPDYGPAFTTNIVMNFPTANILVTTNVTINVPAYIPTHLNAYANYAVQP